MNRYSEALSTPTPSTSRAMVHTSDVELSQRSHTPPLTVEHMQKQIHHLREVEFGHTRSAEINIELNSPILLVNKKDGGTRMCVDYRALNILTKKKITVPYHTMHNDHLGPFIKSKKGNTQLLVMVDGFTKFTILEPVRNTKTKHVVKCMQVIIDIFGVPMRIISDRGTTFMSHRFRQFCLDLGIKHIQNAVATPRANRQCERVNCTVLGALAALNWKC
uniref:Integrase catalytic domain-containing protein n=1 Tax=Anoplophora glabripennis TaxID=217634 RepID=V5GUH8_ANOGL